MIIVDTSVAVKWFFTEADSPSALALLEEDVLGAPDLLLYEFSNVLATNKVLTETDAQDLLKILYRFKLQFFVLPETAQLRVIALCKRYGITAYDASFIALAEILNTDFITADQKLVRRVPDLPYVRGIGENL